MDQDQRMIAWAAGLFEGEGTARLRRGNYPQMALNSTDEDVVRKFGDVVGVGTVTGPTNYGGSFGTKPKWHWQAWGIESFAQIYAMFRPYLGDRRGSKFDEIAKGMHRKRRTVAECGTKSGYNRHLRLSEVPCPKCREAARATEGGGEQKCAQYQTS